ncbi:MAG: flavodoxin family protein [Spirochaetales bacterium]|uniref:Flavodoxin family protein n=1 Tax=Candidatus Thalassospirochaeta sargassi TaxID=3119039 RepID=A0AAJ1ICR9_9SPIO|nr:flavodoxin family protein [Spirochaetales bacterium]
MKILAINGSPRKGGNTEIILNEVMKPLKEAGWDTELIKIGGTPMRGCLGCRKCFDKSDGTCIVAADMFNEIVPKAFEADALLLGSPTFYADVSSEMKAFIDRLGYVAAANGRALKGKIGASVSAVRRGGSIHAVDSMNHLFPISGMIIPGATYWNMVYGRGPGEVTSDEEGMANMRNLGRAIDWLAKATVHALDSFPEFE